MSFASRGLAPREGLESLVNEDGSYRPASTATPWAAGRQVWGPPFPERRQRPLLPRGPVHPTPHRELFIQTPSTTLTVHQGMEAAVFDRLQLAAVAKESLGFS